MSCIEIWNIICVICKKKCCFHTTYYFSTEYDEKEFWSGHPEETVGKQQSSIRY